MTTREDIFKMLPVNTSSKILHIGWGPQKKALLTFSIKPNNETGIHFDMDGRRKLPVIDNSIDCIILDRSLARMVYRESFVKECMRVLCAGGIILLLELHHDAFGMHNNDDKRVALDDALEYFESAGFLIGEKLDVDHNEYGIIAVRPANSSESVSLL